MPSHLISKREAQRVLRDVLRKRGKETVQVTAICGVTVMGADSLYDEDETRCAECWEKNDG